MRWFFTQKNRVEPVAGAQSGKNLRVASPCSAKWEEMKGTDWMRHCTECNLNVYNFSEMTWKEVERLIASRQGRLCARFYRRSDGTVLTQDCPKGLRAVVRRVSRWAGAALSAVTVISSGQAQARSWAEHIEQAQTESGSATGSPTQGGASVAIQVKYPGGAAMSYIRVVLLGRRGEQIRDAITDEHGRARMQSLEAGTYRLVVRSAAFEGDPQAFVLGERDAIEVSFTLRPAPLMGDVIAADAPLIPVERSEPKIDLLAIAGGNENLQHPAGVGIERHAGGKSSSSPVIAYASFALKVKDKRGETIGGAAIILRDSRDGRQWTGVSDSLGNFVVPSLPRGRYILTVRANGFNAYFTQVDALRSGEISLEALLPAKHTSGLVNIEEIRMDSAARGNGAETAFR